jgi:hypothetical protein
MHSSEFADRCARLRLKSAGARLAELEATKFPNEAARQKSYADFWAGIAAAKERLAQKRGQGGTTLVIGGVSDANFPYPD